MIEAAETFDGTWPFAPQFTDSAGFRQHFVDIGPRDGEPVVLLHGEPTWGYLWRHLIGPLSRSRRVIVPDHMGFGKSAMPAERGYLAEEHIDNLDTLLVGELGLTGITLVMHDWGGPIGTGFALRHPDRVTRQQLVAPDPADRPAPPDPAAVTALRAKPAVLVEGMRDTALLPRHIIPAFRLAYPDAPVIELPHAGHFTPEDAPQELLAALEMFLHTS